MKWAQTIVAIGAFCALTTTMMTTLIGAPRIYFSMSRDGLLPNWISRVNQRFKTPVIATAITCILSSLLAFFFDIDTLADMVSIGTLLAFTIVCVCVVLLRYKTQPQNNLNRKVLLILLGTIALASLCSVSWQKGWNLAISIVNFDSFQTFCLKLVHIWKRFSAFQRFLFLD